jgi:hypothetical protein
MFLSCAAPTVVAGWPSLQACSPVRVAASGQQTGRHWIFAPHLHALSLSVSSEQRCKIPANGSLTFANPFGPEFTPPQFIPYSSTTSLSLSIIDQDYPKIQEVDAKLIALAKDLQAKIITNVAAMERGFNEVKIQKFRKPRAEYFWGG